LCCSPSTRFAFFFISRSNPISIHDETEIHDEFIERGIERETREKPVIPVLDSSTLCIRARNLP
jgi:hypothetical protein